MATPFSGPAGKLKRGRASLFGGMATGLCVLALWLGFEIELGALHPAVTGLGVVAAAVVAAWVRVADL
jgi:hypothetical protein